MTIEKLAAGGELTITEAKALAQEWEEMRRSIRVLRGLIAGGTKHVQADELNVRGDIDVGGDITIGGMHMGNPTYTSINDFFKLFTSAGRITGGAVTDGGSETVNVAAGTGVLRIADDDISQVKFFDWAAETGHAITTDTVRYVGIEYNSGSPQVVVKTTDTFDFDTDFHLAKVVNDGGALHILNNPWWVSDGLTNIIERFKAEGLVVRDSHLGGLVLSVEGTRNIDVTAGTLWSNLTEFPFSAFASDPATFETYWVNSSGEWTEADVVQYPVTQWNDTTLDALQTMTNNWYANWWVYIEADDDEVALVYPQAQYANRAVAEAEGPPSNVPTHISENGILIGRIIFQQGQDAPIQVDTAWETVFNPSQAADHGNLAGLADDDHTQYILHSLADAANDFLVASGNDVFVKKTLAETGAILEADIDHGNIQGLDTGADHSYIDQDVTTTGTPTFAKATIGGMQITGDGTSFPGTPATNDLFYRTDLGWLCYYDGTRWLTCHDYHASSEDTQQDAASGTLCRIPMRQDYDPYLTRVTHNFYVYATNDATHNWTIAYYLRNAAFGGGAQMYAHTTSADAQATWLQHDAAPSTNLHADSAFLLVTSTKNNSPGDLVYSATVHYKLIVT